MIKILTNTLRLGSKIFYAFSIPRRDPSLPTEANFIRPFSINTLSDNEGSRRYPKQLGRGPGNGKGKFSARGMKGHKSRTGGGVPVRFEGGQTPISRRLPKFGRVKRRSARQIFDTVNLADIDYFVKKGILNSHQVITIKHLNDCGLVKKVKFGVKILGKGFDRINYPLKIEVSDASGHVINHIEENGGQVKLVFRTQLKLKEHLNPEKFPLPLAQPLPPAWRAKKLARIEKARNHQIVYRKPKWQIEDELEEKQNDNKGSVFVYPALRDPQPQKIRTRKAKIYRKISYNL